MVLKYRSNWSLRYRAVSGVKLDSQAIPVLAWRDALIHIALEAGERIMSVYAREFGVGLKDDASPVTEADVLAEELILHRLRLMAPNIPVVAEEEVANGRVPQVASCFWLVDPLDGTKEFVSRNGEFTVNIALIQDGIPILGVVFAPALGWMFAGAVGHGAISTRAGVSAPIRVRSPPNEGVKVVASRSHGNAPALEAFLAGRRVAETVAAGSSLKFCLVASGEADVYPRFGRTMEWDTAAGHAIVIAAGGRVNDLLGQPIKYGKSNFENPHFVASA
jgi:3'(2'), 5'-bisphosphate nucleotidase